MAPRTADRGTTGTGAGRPGRAPGGQGRTGTGAGRGTATGTRPGAAQGRPQGGSRRPAALVGAAALVVGALVGGAVGWTAGGSAGPAGATAAASEAPEPGSIEAVAAQLAEGQEADRAARATELAAAAEVAHDQLPTVLVGLAALVPPAGGDSGATVPAADVAAWTAALDTSADALGATAEGDEDQTVTRGALLGAVGLLRSAVEATAGLPAEAGPARQEQLARVARDRDGAVALWQSGATRLDGLVLDAGGEHTHLFLAPDGDPDSVPREFQEPDED